MYLTLANILQRRGSKAGMNRFDNYFEKHWAVVGLSRDLAEKLINAIEIVSGKEAQQRTRSKNEIRTLFVDGTTLRWIKASENSRGFKIGVMWCAKNISKNIFDCVILPMYMGKYEDIIWVEEETLADNN